MELKHRIFVSRRIEFCQALRIFGIFQMVNLLIFLYEFGVSLGGRSSLLVSISDKFADIRRRLRGFLDHLLEELFWLARMMVISAQRPNIGGVATKIVTTVLASGGRFGSH